MVEDVQVPRIVQLAQIAQGADTATAVDPVVFAVETPPEELHRRENLPKVNLRNIDLLILISIQKIRPVSHQKYLLTKLMSILIPIIEILQKLKP
jgi:hypothetical protein